MNHRDVEYLQNLHRQAGLESVPLRTRPVHSLLEPLEARLQLDATSPEQEAATLSTWNETVESLLQLLHDLLRTVGDDYTTRNEQRVEYIQRHGLTTARDYDAVSSDEEADKAALRKLLEALDAAAHRVSTEPELPF